MIRRNEILLTRESNKQRRSSLTIVRHKQEQRPSSGFIKAREGYGGGERETEIERRKKKGTNRRIPGKKRR